MVWGCFQRKECPEGEGREGLCSSQGLREGGGVQGAGVPRPLFLSGAG